MIKDIGDPDDIFHNWDKYGAEEYQLIKKLYNEATKKILDENGGFPDCKLSELPNYRTSKSNILKRIPKNSDLQMIPTIPNNIKEEATGQGFNQTKVSLAFLQEKK